MILLTSQKELRKLADPVRSARLSAYFKTGKGEYGEGDTFLGVTVPQIRKIAKAHSATPISDVRTLLRSPVHEDRLLALMILVEQFPKATQKDTLFSFVLEHTIYINNWDLVDTISPGLIGPYLLDKKRSTLIKLAQSKNIWERRIAIVSTYTFIRHNDFGDTLRIAEILFSDKHDLIHKAVGWMLREVGNRDMNVLDSFLRKNIARVPRTTLRYAIERFSENKRQAYLRM